MRFRPDTYDAEVERLIDELLDEKTIAEMGDAHFAFEAFSAVLGLKAGDTVEIVGGYVVTPESPEEIDRLIAIAREGRARGESLGAMADAGKFTKAE